MFSTSENTLDPSLIRHSPECQTKGDIRSYNLSYNGGNLRLRTPWLSSPDGIRELPGSPNPSYCISFCLREYDTDPELKAFYQCLKSLDTWILTQAKDDETRQRWTFPQCSVDMLDDLFLPSIQEDSSGPYSPTLRVKLPFDQQECLSMVTRKRDMNQELGDVREVLKGPLWAKLELTFNVWSNGVRFGVDKVVRDIIYEPLSFGDYIMSRGNQFRRSTDSLFLDLEDPCRQPTIYDNTDELISAPFRMVRHINRLPDDIPDIEPNWRRIRIEPTEFNSEERDDEIASNVEGGDDGIDSEKGSDE